jgi:hypothetical protein
MPQVEIPSEIHEKVEEYAQNRGYSVGEAYAELVEFALRETERDEDDDLQSGIA